VKRKVAITAKLIMFLFLAQPEAQELWVGKDGNVRNSDARALVIGSGEMYLATRNEIYRSGQVKERWESIFSLPSSENEINCVAGRNGTLFAGTRRGLFRSDDRGRTWRNVFKTIIPEKSDILAAETPRYARSKVVLGTERGVFISEDNGSGWKDISGILKNVRINGIVCGKDAIYASGDEGVFVRRSGSEDWERVYGKSASSEGVEMEEPAAVEIEEPDGSPAACIALRDARLYMGIGNKLSYSDDGGKGWVALPSNGLKGDARCILPAQGSDKAYCSTTRGVFEFSPEKKQWLELYRGMEKAVNVRSIVFDRDGESSLWAITDKGLYKFEAGRYADEQALDVERSIRNISIIYDGEPAFRDLQAAALKFAEVSPEKIAKWRTQARLKALVPKISLGIDNNSSNTYEIYTSATRDYIVQGPDDNTKGFDVTVSWDLGGMIWSDDQTNIDVRSRLTTQLRNDILDDLRRSYYERKRLQFEMMASSPRDMKLKFEKELRIRELTQAIDDLTGNYLTDHMKQPDRS